MHALQRKDRRLRKPELVTDTLHQFGVVALDIDPEQLMLLECVNVDLHERDIAIGTFGVIQGDVQAVVRRLRARGRNSGIRGADRIGALRWAGAIGVRLIQERAFQVLGEAGV